MELENKENEFRLSLLDSKNRVVAITNNEELDVARNELLNLNKQKKMIKDTFDTIIANANKSHKDAIAKRKEFLEPVEELSNYIKGLMSDYAIKREKAITNNVENEKILKMLESAKERGDTDLVEILQDRLENAPTLSLSVRDEGITYIDDYEIEILNDSAIPITLGSSIVRPIDLGAVKRYIKESGNTNIEGLKITKTKSVRVNGRKGDK